MEFILDFILIDQYTISIILGLPYLGICSLTNHYIFAKPGLWWSSLSSLVILYFSPGIVFLHIIFPIQFFSCCSSIWQPCLPGGFWLPASVFRTQTFLVPNSGHSNKFPQARLARPALFGKAWIYPLCFPVHTAKLCLPRRQGKSAFPLIFFTVCPLNRPQVVCFLTDNQEILHDEQLGSKTLAKTFTILFIYNLTAHN